MSPDAQLIPLTGNSLRVVHEINFDTHLASQTFSLVFLHCWNTGNIESCLEAITASLRLSVPIHPQLLDSDVFPLGDPFEFLSDLAHSIGEVVRGERDINGGDYEASHAMKVACESGAADLIEPLFWRGAELDGANLIFAIYSGSFDTVRFCLALGADPNHCSPVSTFSPLVLALANPETKNSHIASLLIEYGAVVSVANEIGETPLHLAAQRADVDLLRLLLAKESSSKFLDATDYLSNRALDHAIESLNSGIPESQVLEFVSALLNAGADVDGLDYDGTTLSHAVRDGRGAIVRLLLEREPESPRKVQYLKESLLRVLDPELGDVFEILVEAGASVDDKMLRYALRYESPEGVELLLRARVQEDLIGVDFLELLFDAVRDQQLPGAEGGEVYPWIYAMAKCKLLCRYSPNDQRLHELSASLGLIP